MSAPRFDNEARIHQFAPPASGSRIEDIKARLGIISQTNNGSMQGPDRARTLNSALPIKSGPTEKSINSQTTNLSSPPSHSDRRIFASQGQSFAPAAKPINFTQRVQLPSTPTPTAQRMQRPNPPFSSTSEGAIPQSVRLPATANPRTVRPLPRPPSQTQTSGPQVKSPVTQFQPPQRPSPSPTASKPPPPPPSSAKPSRSLTTSTGQQSSEGSTIDKSKELDKASEERRVRILGAVTKEIMTTETAFSKQLDATSASLNKLIAQYERNGSKGADGKQRDLVFLKNFKKDVDACRDSSKDLVAFLDGQKENPNFVANFSDHVMQNKSYYENMKKIALAYDSYNKGSFEIDRTDPKFQKRMKFTNEEKESMSPIIIVQRPPRHELLVREIQKHTNPGLESKTENLKNYLQSVAKDINQSKAIRDLDVSIPGLTNDKLKKGIDFFDTINNSSQTKEEVKAAIKKDPSIIEHYARTLEEIAPRTKAPPLLYDQDKALYTKFIESNSENLKVLMDIDGVRFMPLVAKALNVVVTDIRKTDHPPEEMKRSLDLAKSLTSDLIKRFEERTRIAAQNNPKIKEPYKEELRLLKQTLSKIDDGLNRAEKALNKKK